MLEGNLIIARVGDRVQRCVVLEYSQIETIKRLRQFAKRNGLSIASRKRLMNSSEPELLHST